MKGVVYILPVIGVVTLAHFILKYVRKKIKQIRDEASMPSKDDLIPALSGVDINSLAVLSQSNDINLRRCAEQFIVERFTSKKEYLEALFAECLAGDTLKGCTVLITVVTNGYWPVGFDTVTMLTMAKVLVQNSHQGLVDSYMHHQRIDQLACEGLFTSYAMEYNPAEKLKTLFQEVPDIATNLLEKLENNHDKDILRCSLLMVHEFICHEESEKYVVSSGGITIISQVFKKLQGNCNMQNLCLQSLIELSNKYPIEPVVFDVRRQLVACLRTDENENKMLIKHALMMLSKLSEENLVKLAEIPGIIGAFSRNLSGSSELQKCVLEVLYVVACESESFREQILNCNDIVNVLPVLYLSSRPSVCSYALALTYCCLGDCTDGAVIKLLTTNEKLIPSLNALMSIDEMQIHRLVLGILAVFCGCEDPAVKKMAATAVPAIIHIMKLYLSDKDFQLGATGMLLNLASISDSNKKVIIEAGGIDALIDVVWTFENYETYLVSMAVKMLLLLSNSGCSCQMVVQFSHDYGSLSLTGNRVIVTKPKFDVFSWKLSENKLKQITHIVSLSEVDNSAELDLINEDFTKSVDQCGGMVYIFTATGPSSSEMMLTFFNEGFKGIVVFEDSTTLNSVLSPNKNCILFTLKSKNKLHVKHCLISDNESDDVNLEIPIHLDDIVKQIILDNLTQPVISSIVNLPANVSVSKASELALLEVLTYERLHADCLLMRTDWYGQLRYMIIYISDCMERQQEEEPLGFIHCLAAVKLLAILALPSDNAQLPLKEFLPLLLRLQNAISNLWIKEKIDSLTDIQKETLKNYNEILQNISCVVQLILYRICRVTRPIDDVQSIYSTWSLILSSANISSNFEVMSGYTLTSLCCFEETHALSIPLCTLSATDCTRGILLSADKLKVSNVDDRTFESIRSECSLSASDEIMSEYNGWYYEVTLDTAGVIQIGWATDDCKFNVLNALNGLGVGDDQFSYAYDGDRAKKWNGPSTSNKDLNDYGEKWSEGTVVGCLLSKTGQISYTQNGKPLGIAFQDLDMEKRWFAGASFSACSNEQATFNFGASEFSFPPPADFISMFKYVQARAKSDIDSDMKNHTETDAEIPDVDNFLNSLDPSLLVPSLYYEIQLTTPPKQTLEFGYITGNKTDKKACTLKGNVLELPDFNQVTIQYPLCIGIGYLLYETAFLVTINGQLVVMKFPMTLTGEVHLVPYFNCSMLNSNFGAIPFRYSVCNGDKYKLTAAALLMDYYTISSKNET